MAHIRPRTPILDALIHYANQRGIPLHVPGHKQGQLLPESLSTWIGAASKLDLTELPGLDNLQDPKGCILESERLAARTYGSDACFYSVNGSTAGVMASIAATAGPGDEVLFLNRFHQSAWRALVLSGASPVMAPIAFDSASFEFGFPTIPQIVDLIQTHPRIRVAFLTTPTYSGRVADVPAIAQVLHRAGIPLVVDEAHGAHLGFHPALPNHSVGAGADVVVQSAHKMLPALTQTAWVHCREGRVSIQAVADWLRYLHSTSPSYLLLASLDAVQAWLSSDGQAALDVGLRALSAARLGGGTWMATSHLRDPFKSWVPTGSIAESQRLVAAMERRGMVLEYADGFGALGIHRLSVTTKEAQMFVDVVRDWAVTFAGPDAAMAEVASTVVRCGVPQLTILPRDAAMAQTRRIPLAVSAGRVIGQMITPYPPGVPIAFPGQVMDANLMDAITYCRHVGIPMQGLTADGEIPVLDV